jgi:carboxypeptidase D
MNPDGFELGSRYNAPVAPTEPVDLNRDFPDQFDAPGTNYVFQPETQAIMDWCNEHHFIMSISFHGGDLVVNYPWDGNRDVLRSVCL